jgi:CBS domain-containing protein
VGTKDEGAEGLKKVAESRQVSLMPAREIMTEPVLTVSIGTKVYFAAKMLQTHRISGAPVVDNSGKLVGILSDYDLLIQTATRDVSGPVEYVKEPVAIELETPLKDIIVILHKTKFHRLPVVDKHRKVVGVVARIDVLKKLLGLP